MWIPGLFRLPNAIRACAWGSPWAGLILLLAAWLVAPAPGFAQEPATNRFDVQLCLKDGYLAVDEASTNTQVHPSAAYLRVMRHSEAELRRVLIASMNDALRQYGQIYKRADAGIVAAANAASHPIRKLTADWEGGKRRLQEWFTAAGGTAQDFLMDSGPFLILRDEGFGRNLGGGPIDWRVCPDDVFADPDFYEPLAAGRFQVTFTDPLRAEDLEQDPVRFGLNPGAFASAGIRTQDLTRLLGRLKGEVWSPERVHRLLGDYLLDRGVKSFFFATNQSLRLQYLPPSRDRGRMQPVHFARVAVDNTAKRVVLDGPPRLWRILVEGQHRDPLTRRTLHTLLPDALWRRLPEGTNALLRELAVGTNRWTALTLADDPETPPLFVNHRQLDGWIAEIKGLKGDLKLNRIATPQNHLGDPSTTWTEVMVNRAMDDTQDAVATDPQSKTNLTRFPDQFRNHLRLGAGISTDRKGRVLLEYSRDDLLGGNVAVGVGYEDQPLGNGAYSTDFLGFESWNRRLRLSVSGGSDFRTERATADSTAATAPAAGADERRSGGEARLVLDEFRDRNHAWLQASLRLAHHEVESTVDDQVETREGISEVELGARFFWERPDHPNQPRLEVSPRLLGGYGNNAGRGFALGGLEFGAHALGTDFVEYLCRGRLTWATDETPESELPRLGGGETVRGFREEAALGQGAWAVQTEVLLPIRFGERLGRTVDGMVRRAVRVALFADIGGIENSPGAISGFQAGAGVGLDLRLQEQASLRIDWGHALTSLDRSEAGSFVYFTARIQPAHF